MGLLSNLRRLGRRREQKENGNADRRLLQRELADALRHAATPEHGFQSYMILRAEFGADASMQMELRDAFQPEWMPFLRRHLGNYLRAGLFLQAEGFMREMRWEWQEGTDEDTYAAVVALVGQLQEPVAHPSRAVMRQILEGFRGAGLGATKPVVKWLTGTYPEPRVVEKVLFQEGGAGGRYLLRQWAERDARIAELLDALELDSAPFYRKRKSKCTLWPSERGESPIARLGAQRLGLDFNAFGPEKAEQDPVLPDLYYRLSPVWEEVTSLQPGIIVAPPGSGRSALLWMIRYECGLIGSSLEQVFPVYMPFRAVASAQQVAKAMETPLLEALCCALSDDPYALMGLEEGDQRYMSEFLMRTAGGPAPVLDKLHSAGLPPGDPDGQLLREVLYGMPAAGANNGGGATLAPARRAEGPAGSTDGYNLAAVRRLLQDAFSTRELWRFCEDRPVFRPVLDRVGRNASLSEMVDLLIGYCDRQVLLPDLLAEVEIFNPRQYERHQGQVLASNDGQDPVRDSVLFGVPQEWALRPYGSEYTFLLIDLSFQSERMVNTLLELLFGWWLPMLAPRQIVPKLFVPSCPEYCPVTPTWLRWDRAALRNLLRHRLACAGLVLPEEQPALDGWIEGMENPDEVLIQASRGQPELLIKLGNRLIRRMAQPEPLGRQEFMALITQGSEYL